MFWLSIIRVCLHLTDQCYSNPPFLRQDCWSMSFHPKSASTHFRFIFRWNLYVKEIKVFFLKFPPTLIPTYFLLLINRKWLFEVEIIRDTFRKIQPKIILKNERGAVLQMLKKSRLLRIVEFCILYFTIQYGLYLKWINIKAYYPKRRILAEETYFFSPVVRRCKPKTKHSV